MGQDNGKAPDVSLVRAGDGRSLWVVGDTYTFKATGDSTGGALALLEASIPPGSGPPPHVHADEDEAFYVLSGALQVAAGEQILEARAGDFVFVPRGTLHSFKNLDVQAARALILSVPAGLDRFFEDRLACPSGRASSIAQSSRVGKHHRARASIRNEHPTASGQSDSLSRST